MDKNAIKKFAIWARRDLIERVTQRAMKYGIVANEPADPNADSANGYLFSPIEKRQRQTLISKIQEKGFEQVIEEVAYTWFNRFAALRFMEVNDYLPTHIRVFTNEAGEFKPQILSEAIHLDIQGLDLKKVYELESANKKDELYKYLLIVQCNALNSILPRMFQKIEDYTELLLPDNLLREENIIHKLVTDISEEDFDVSSEDGKGQIEIIGWLYQYYNTEPKDKVFADLKKNIKISKENIPAATQLFTPDWIVHYMVENSLGRLWLEGHPNDTLKSNWKYYLDEAEQEADVQVQLDKIRKEYANLKPEEILVIDPCMGSGHILCVLFDVLVQIYTDYGYSEKEAVASIIEKNLFGLDIDERATQLAYFAVMMKARQYDRRFFSRNLQPHVYAICESNGIRQEVIDYFVNRHCEPSNDGVAIQTPFVKGGCQAMPDRGIFNSNTEVETTKKEKISPSALQAATPLYERGSLEQSLKRLLDQTKDATEYGSLITISDIDFDLFYQRIEEIKNDDSFYRLDIINQLLPLIEVAQVLAQKYHVVVTNPPYMGSGGMGNCLSNFIRKNYSISKSDLCNVMLQHGLTMLRPNGYEAMITMESWMYLTTSEHFRDLILHNSTIISLIHMPYLGKGGTSLGINFGTQMSIMMNCILPNYAGIYDRIVYTETNEEGIPFEFPVKNNYYQSFIQSNFFMIPGIPLAYWIPKFVISLFEQEKLDSYGSAVHGFLTGHDDGVIFLWHEVSWKDISLKVRNLPEEGSKETKYVPLIRGGEYRKWYGNYCLVLRVDGWSFKFLSNYPEFTLKGRNYYFREGVSWPLVTSGKFSAKFLPEGYLFGNNGPSIFCNKEIETMQMLGFMNSCVAEYFLDIINPTMSCSAGVVKKLPVVSPNLWNYSIAIINKDICKHDWDSFETSWDFVGHPLVQGTKNTPFHKGGCQALPGRGIFNNNAEPESNAENENLSVSLCSTSPLKKGSIKEVYQQWSQICTERFNKLKSNEEELNRIFIDIYGLNDELTPEVEDKDVTVRKADLQREIRSFISYAVGCMMGRYSLDCDGLAFAGGEWDKSKYTSFIPDEDGIIPITDDEYFNDDIVGRFIDFVKVVYGEDTLEDNLKFIADAIGGKGSARQVIRNYFISEFFADHVKVYQKRPIYWQFDSGKKNGFKCLIYMHRYQPDTLARIRTDYVHEQQARYRTVIADLEQRINGASTSERVKLNKQLAKIKDQAEEIRLYEEKIHHLADQMIKIDLDDGVKHNYAIFESVLAKIKLSPLSLLSIP